MKLTFLSCWLLACAVGLVAATGISADIPHLEKRDGMTKLIVDGRPFICVAGELSNSASTDRETMKLAWPRLAAENLNTILTVVSWDLIEPEEGKFDFWMVDYQLEAARANHLRLILLWMGSWKNGLSHYTPRWVKIDQGRFPRVMTPEGRSLEILTTLSQANRDADARAFVALMKHIREVDSKEHTVIAVQVENEIGVRLHSTRLLPGGQRGLRQTGPPRVDRLSPAAQGQPAARIQEGMGRGRQQDRRRLGRGLRQERAPSAGEARRAAHRQARRRGVLQPRRRDLHGLELRPLRGLCRPAGQERVSPADVRQCCARRSGQPRPGRLSQRRARTAGA